MNWISILTQKAKENSSLRKIQLQFLWILVIFALSLNSYKLYTKSISIENAFMVYGIISILAVIFLFKPIILKPLLFIWLIIGLLLGEITSTLILAVVYYLLFFPITFIIRKFNKDKLNVKWYSKKDHIIDYQRLF